MTYRLRPFLTFGCAVAGLLLLLFAAGAALSGHNAHAQSPVVRVDPAARTVDVSGGKFTVNILIDNVTNLGAYEFELQFDPDVLRFVGVEDADFLGSTGREVHCPGGTIDPPKGAGQPETLKFGCATRNPSPIGPDGSGVLATVTLAPRKAGHSPLTLIASSSSTGTADVEGNDLHPMSGSGDVTVVGEGPAATPEPDEPTPLPAPNNTPAANPTPAPDTNWMFTPEPGQTPMSRPMPGRQMTKPSADGLAAASLNSNTSSGSNQGSPRAGTGPERETSRWPTITGLLLMAGGVLLLSFAAYTRRDRTHSAG